MSSEDFTELGASRSIAEALAARGIETPFAIQRLVIPDALAGRDVLAQSPTGSGKTLAFALPIVERLDAGDPRPSALVLAPTRELATQIVERGRAPLARARAPDGRRGLRRRRDRAPAQAGPPRPHPGRHSRSARGPARAAGTSRWPGQDPRPRRGRPHARHGLPARPSTASSAAIPRERQTLFFSATLDGAVGQLARAYTRDAAPPRARAAARASAARSTTASSRSRTSASSRRWSRELDDGTAA